MVSKSQLVDYAIINHPCLGIRFRSFKNLSGLGSTHHPTQRRARAGVFRLGLGPFPESTALCVLENPVCRGRL